MPLRSANRLCRLIAALMFLAGAIGDVQAHAVLSDSQPADGASVAESPAEIVLRFNEPVSPVNVRLLDEDGREVPNIAVESGDDTLVLRPGVSLKPGGYFLSYRVTSLDAHAVGATLRFGIGAPAPGAEGRPEQLQATAWLAASARWLFYLLALGALGASMFAGLVRPGAHLDTATRVFAARLAGAGCAALVLRLGAAGLDLAGLPFAALFTARPWMIAVGTSLGPASALAGLGLVAVMVGRRWPAWLSGLGCMAIAASFALTGHAASAEPRLLTALALGLHVLCAGFWAGSLLPLLWCLRLPPAQAAAVLRRFSAWAAVAVAVLVVAGVALAWVQLGGGLTGLWQTGYGLRLLVKLALVAGLLALAGVNRFVLTPRLARGHSCSVRGLRVTLGADIVLALAVLGVTATFPFSPPPRSLTADAGGITVVASTPAGQATFTLVPGRVGANRLEAGVVDRDGAPLAARRATLAWSLPAAGIEASHVEASLPLPGVVIAAGLALPTPGRWRLRLDLLIDDFTKLTYEGEIEVR